MARCELTGKRPVVKNLVSHSNIKTKRLTQPNVQSKTIFSQVLGRPVRLYMAASTIRSVDHVGGFDKFILNQSAEQLSPRALRVQQQIKARMKKKSTDEKAAGEKRAST